MSTDAYLQHIINRINADVELLVLQGALSQVDGRAISSKLSTARSSGITGPPAVSAQAPAMPTPYTPPPIAPPVARTPSRIVPPQPARSSGVQARAVWPYNENGEEVGDLSFAAGEIIDIIEETNADWWKGKTAKGDIGLFPSSYVEKLSTAVVPGRRMAPVPTGKSAYDPMAVSVPAPAQPQQIEQAPPKKNKFGKYGDTLAHSAAGGVGFGAGAAIGSGIVHAIF